MKSIFLTLFNEYADWSDSSEPSHHALDSAISILADALTVVPLVQTADLHSTTSDAFRIFSNARNFTRNTLPKTFFYMFDLNVSSVFSKEKLFKNLTVFENFFSIRQI